MDTCLEPVLGHHDITIEDQNTLEDPEKKLANLIIFEFHTIHSLAKETGFPLGQHSVSVNVPYQYVRVITANRTPSITESKERPKKAALEKPTGNFKVHPATRPIYLWNL